jgi:hypothetical protein
VRPFPLFKVAGLIKKLLGLIEILGNALAIQVEQAQVIAGPGEIA